MDIAHFVFTCSEMGELQIRIFDTTTKTNIFVGVASKIPAYMMRKEIVNFDAPVNNIICINV